MLLPDLPGHGGSASLMPFTIADAAARVARLIKSRAAGGVAHVVGLSEGAQVAVALLASEPDVIDHAIVSSALIHPVPHVGTMSPAVWRRTYRLVQPLNRFPWWIRLNMRSNGIPQSYFPQMLDAYATLTPDAFADIMTENQAFRLPAGLAVSASETLVIAGAGEYRVMRDSAREIASALPHGHAYLVRHPRGTPLAEQHNWNMTAPGLFTRTVAAWLRDAPLPDASP